MSAVHGLTGYDEDFISLPPQVVCGICHLVVREAVQCFNETPEHPEACGHVFCTSCIAGWLQTRHRCPLCMRPLSTSQIRPDINLRRCAGRSAGCTWQGMLADLENHRRWCGKQSYSATPQTSSAHGRAPLALYISYSSEEPQHNNVVMMNARPISAAHAAIAQTISNAASSQMKSTRRQSGRSAVEPAEETPSKGKKSSAVTPKAEPSGVEQHMQLRHAAMMAIAEEVPLDSDDEDYSPAEISGASKRTRRATAPVFEEPQRIKRLKRVFENVTPFVGNLYEMVNDPECNHAIRWNANGTAIQLVDVAAIEEVLPRYFNHNNYRSLTKMLTACGFHKVQVSSRLANTIAAEYAHDSFLRGRTDLLTRVSRAASRKKSASSAVVEHDADDLPNQSPMSSPRFEAAATPALELDTKKL